MPVRQPPTTPTELPHDKTREPIGKAIADEVKKDQGETPTFPFGEREFEEKAVGETEDAAGTEGRAKAEAGVPVRQNPLAGARPDDSSQRPPETVLREKDALQENADKTRQERRQDNIESFDAPGGVAGGADKSRGA